jgi:hypothetical protein
MAPSWLVSPRLGLLRAPGDRPGFGRTVSRLIGLDDVAMIASSGRDALAAPSYLRREFSSMSPIDWGSNTAGEVPMTLGGKLPPVSVLARREFSLRALRR